MMYCTGGSQESSSKDIMNFSYPNHNHLHLQQQQQPQQISSSGLMRYRSAPSSFFTNLVNGGGSSADGCDELQYLPTSSSDFDSVFGRLMSHDLHSIDEKLMKDEAIESVSEQNHGSYYNSSSMQSLQNRTDSSLGFVSSIGLEDSIQIKVENGDSLNFGKQSSSPAGIFSNSAIENGLATISETGHFSSCNGTNGGEANRLTSRLKNHINFSLGPSSTSRLMRQTAKIGNESFGISSSENGNLHNSNGDVDSYTPNFTIDSWDEGAFGGLKRTRNDDAKMFSLSQNGDEGNHASGLTRHMSLPSTSTEMAAISKFRAKRGFATHPRSIAERVRRSRISERMKKLQELFPDMDKQANTSDMLDLAVDYIKDLQKQVKTLTDTKSSCMCSSKQK